MDLTGLKGDSHDFELLPRFIDRTAHEDPTRTWGVRPRDNSDLSKGVENITYSAAANAINRAAWFLEQKLGKPEPGSFPIVAYMGTADFRCLLLPIALVKVGYQIFILSDMTTTNTREYLISKSGCKVLMYTSLHGNDPLVTRTSLKSFVVPELDDLLSEEFENVYPYDKTPVQGLNDPLMVLHTSGTSGISGRPKLVHYVLGTLSSASYQRHLPELDGHASVFAKLAELKRLYTGFRVSHAGGSVLSLSFMFLDLPIVLGGEDSVTVDAFNSVLEHADIDSAYVPPLLLEQVVKRPDILEKLSRLKVILYAGGKLPLQVGNAISRRVQLFSKYGSTEYVNIPIRSTEPEDWQYLHFDPVHSGMTWVPHPPNDPMSKLFEAVAIRHSDPAIRRSSTVFWNFPDRTEWPMGDLFEPHPMKANHWKYICRKDDMLILANGVNVMPMFFEQEILGRDHRIAKAVLYGNNQSHLAVLIELVIPAEGADMVAQKKEELWPLIEKCNQRLSKATQINRKAIIIADKQRPLPRGGKGDVQRLLAEAIYQRELDEAFQT